MKEKNIWNTEKRMNEWRETGKYGGNFEIDEKNLRKKEDERER